MSLRIIDIFLFSSALALLQNRILESGVSRYFTKLAWLLLKHQYDKYFYKEDLFYKHSGGTKR